MSDLWTAVGPLDLLDVIVVAFLIYRLLLVVRGTRGIQVLGGLLLLAGLYGLSRVLELSTVNWILEKFSFYLVLAVIILFQEDIRRALARFGNPLIGAGSQREQLSTYQSVGRACFRLADQGAGALIAVERRGSLVEFEHEATLIDGVLSAELLVSIFQKTSPIHDGAALVREDRVWLAGVFLPLSVRGGLDGRYGTRHRAAIGLTEQADSLVFLVSEERRSVSIAFRGDLYEVESPDELRLKVQELLAMEEVEVSAPTGFVSATPTLTPTPTSPVAAVEAVGPTLSVQATPVTEALEPDRTVPPPSRKPPSGGGEVPPELTTIPPMAGDLSDAPPIQPVTGPPVQSVSEEVPLEATDGPSIAESREDSSRGGASAADGSVPLVELPGDSE
jgi:diadenylate cyclase